MTVKHLIGAVFALAACLITAAAVFSLFPDLGPDPAPETDDGRIERQVIDSVIAGIDAESAGRIPASIVATAPLASPGRQASPETPPTPPAGYSFVAFRGEMAKGDLESVPAAPADPSVAAPDWIGSVAAVPELSEQAARAGRYWTYGWIRLASNARVADVETDLARLGAEILGSSGRLVRARLPGSRAALRAISSLRTVDGIGAAPLQAKLSPDLAHAASLQPAQHRVPVFVTLMSDDADGSSRRSLQAAGAVVGRLDSTIRVVPASIPYGSLSVIAAFDFVLAVEPIGIVKAAHDTAVPAMGVDTLREYAVADGLFTGTVGASVPVGVLDTGLNINHVDIASNRESICGANFIIDTDDATEIDDLWIDRYGHGTHVTGTIVGAGAADPRLAGMAPAVRHIRVAKVLNRHGYGSGFGVLRGMDYLAAATACGVGRLNAGVRPLIVNMSLSRSSTTFEGRDVAARKVDSVAWSNRQLYVVSQANAGDRAFSNYGAAKNSLSIGAAMDSGQIAAFSSHGPTADGRLAPQVVATGVSIHSAAGVGSRSEYDVSSGTSMASPTVVGIAALLMDAAPEHREQPALVRARLMASAVRPEAWLDDESAFPPTNTRGPGSTQAQYGMGKASARTAILNRDDASGWVSGAAIATLKDGEYSFVDIEVPQGASRLDIVMTWDEPAAEAVASTVLNDLNLWLDHGGDCGGVACGEYASTSPLDNVEWIVVRNPEPGTWRARVAAGRVYTTEPPRAALAWTVVRGASTPKLQIDAKRIDLASGRSAIDLTLTADEYVAAGTGVHVDCRAPGESSACDQVEIRRVRAVREDGLTVDLAEDIRRPEYGGYARTSDRPGATLPVGEVAVGKARKVRLEMTHDASDPVLLHFTANAWNATAAAATVSTGTSGDEVPARSPPENDAFVQATTLQGEEGSVSVDLLYATTEPGEPAFMDWWGPPAGSVWYLWTAPAEGSYRFEVDARPDGLRSRYDRLDLYEGESIATLRSIATGRWGIHFFAEVGKAYRVRLSHGARGDDLALRWFPASRPANDDFAQAAVVAGEGSGDVVGSNTGAGLEPNEWLGSATATTWHRWTAPQDGWYQWQLVPTSDERRVLAFQGESIETLRLVSGFPSTTSTFLAREGEQYQIAVASWSSEGTTGAYRLRRTLRSPNQSPVANDEVANAEEVVSASTGTLRIPVESGTTVSPAEPVETGVRTRWWRWEAPAEGRYTWRFDRPSDVLLSVFGESSSDQLEFIGSIVPGTAGEVVVEAERGERFHIAGGLANGSIEAFNTAFVEGALSWGTTPENDAATGAITLAGAAGLVSGSNRFATSPGGERTAALGRSTLWWRYEAPKSGWLRITVDGPGGPWALAVHRDAGAGPELIRSSRWHPDTEPTEVVFHAEKGAVYAVSVGVHGAGTGGEFKLAWAETDPPAWLRYVGHLAPEGVDAAGRPLNLGDTGALAFNGPSLYLGAASGLHVFEREPYSGALTLRQVLEGDFHARAMVWDNHRERLVVEGQSCREWRVFAPVDGGMQLAEGDQIVVDAAPCQDVSGLATVFSDSNGDSLYRFGAESFDVFAVDPDGAMRWVERGVLPQESARRTGLISRDDRYVYSHSNHVLITLQRDAGTGALTQVHEVATEIVFLSDRSIALSDDGRYLVSVGHGGFRTQVFGLEDPARPQLLDTLHSSRTWPVSRQVTVRDGCQPAPGRLDSLYFDVVCNQMAYSVQWRPSDGVLLDADFVSYWQADRYNNAVPFIGEPTSIAVSPDGRHIYVSSRAEKGIVKNTADGGIHLFERIGAGAVDAARVERAGLAPLVPPASNPVRQGFVRIVNHSNRPGEVRIAAVDDTGTEGGELRLDIGARATVHVNSQDLESGNEAKGVVGATGAGDGDWRLTLSSELQFEALSYLRATDGFLTSIHDVVASEGREHLVRIFNPARNPNQKSMLRIMNAGEQDASVAITGIDDAGESPGSPAELTVPARSARTVTAFDLETGDGLDRGALGTGTGKWRLRVTSEQPLRVMSLLESPTGHLSNLSTAPVPRKDGSHVVPLFPAASNPSGLQGFLRVINLSGSAGEVRMDVHDDAGDQYGPLTLTLGAGETVHVNSDDIASGNSEKGLSGDAGGAEGHLRLTLNADIEVEVLSYIRTSDGFLSAMHDLVQSGGGRHRVPIFNPASNTNQVSSLRLINPGTSAATVTIAGIDDNGDSPGTEVSLELLAGTATTLQAHELESGGSGFTGALGDGAGKWRLIVDSDNAIEVVNVLASPTGHLSNLSTEAPRP